MVPSLAINAWYLDDGTLAGSAANLATALQIVEEDGPAVGLHLNRAKSLLHISGQWDPSTSPLPPDIPVTHSGLTLLGRPIGRVHHIARKCCWRE